MFVDDDSQLWKIKRAFQERVILAHGWILFIVNNSCASFVNFASSDDHVNANWVLAKPEVINSSILTLTSSTGLYMTIIKMRYILYTCKCMLSNTTFDIFF
jgi:hypothetical protein